MENLEDFIASAKKAPQDMNKIWEDAKLIIAKDMSALSFDVWIQTLEPIEIKNDTFVLGASSVSGKNVIVRNDKYKASILTALGAVDPSICDIDLIVANKEETEVKQAEPATSAVTTTPKYQQTSLNDKQPAEKQQKQVQSFAFNPRYTFDNYVIGNSNRFVAAAAKAVAENPGASYNPLFIYGGVGLGKTHLLHAIGNHITLTHPELNVVYVTIEKFTNDLIESIQKGSNSAKSEFRTKYRLADVLIVDDIQFIINKNSVQEEFFHTFNELNQAGKQIVISSDKPPKDINPLEERLRSRFEWGLLADIGVPEIETRIAILNKKASLERYNVEPEVIEYIADAVKTNIREMEGMLARAVFYATLINQPRVTMDIARDALKNYLIQAEESIDANNVIDVVCKYFNLKKEELLARKRTKEVAEARQIAMYLITEFINMPLASVGNIFGKDHATVIYAKNKVVEDMKKSQKLAVQINDMKQMIKCK